MNEANDKLVKLFQRKKSSWNEQSSSNNLTGDYEPVDLNVYYRFNNGEKKPKNLQCKRVWLKPKYIHHFQSVTWRKYVYQPGANVI